MGENMPCAKHEAEIKTLFEKNKDTNKRIDEMGDIRSILHSLDKNYALQSQLMENVVEHNKKQDIRMDEQHEINIKVNDNLTKLAGQYDTLNNKVDTIGDEQEKLTKKVEENEEKHKIDWRDLVKNFIIKVAIPTGVLYTVVELVKKAL
jgi:predicted nuclease with TOPRIM domain